jgi:hypothetical protein
MLTVLDEYTRQALAVAVRTRMGADDVLEALYPLCYLLYWHKFNKRSLKTAPRIHMVVTSIGGG